MEGPERPVGLDDVFMTHHFVEADRSLMPSLTVFDAVPGPPPLIGSLGPLAGPRAHRIIARSAAER